MLLTINYMHTLLYKYMIVSKMLIQPNFNDSITFGTMKRCSRQGYFELMSIHHSARSGGVMGISFRFALTRRYVVGSH